MCIRDREERDLATLMEKILAIKAEDTVPDQWQVQVLVRVLLKARVILVSSLDDKTCLLYTSRCV